MLLIAFIILLVIVLMYFFLQREHARGKRNDSGMTTQSKSKNTVNDFNTAMANKPFGKRSLFSMFG
jgi:uncharacterized membrane protein